MNVIVTGGRAYNGTGLVEALDALEREHPGFMLFVGDCPTGADLLAREWAKGRSRRQLACAYHGEMECLLWDQFVADWNGLGLKAGPVRNPEMVAVAKRRGKGVRVLCLAAPGDKGTRDCTNKCRRAGFEVREVTM